MKVIVGSQSQRKIDVAKQELGKIFGDKFEIAGYKANSCVPETPWNEQTHTGAKNRAVDCQTNNPNCDIYIGLESGLVERYGDMYEEAWACIIDKNNNQYFGYSSGLKIPNYIIDKMNDLKLEHCEVMTLIENEHNLDNDTWGTYTGQIILREISLAESIRNALCQLSPSDKSFYNKK